MHIRAVEYLPRWRGLSAEADWGVVEIRSDNEAGIKPRPPPVGYADSPRQRGPSHAGIPLNALALVLFGGGFRGGDFTDIGFVRIDDVHRPDDRGLIELLQFARGDQHAGFQR